MNQVHTEDTKFWAGGSEEFHRQHRDRNLGKGLIGKLNRFSMWWPKVLGKLLNRDIDHRLFIQKSSDKK